MIVGPTQLTFMYCELRGSPQRHISSPRIAWRQGVASPPPYSRGQLCVSQPRSARSGQKLRAKAACASLPGPSFAISSQFAGRLSARKARSSARNAASSSLHSKSTAPASRTAPAGIADHGRSGAPRAATSDRAFPPRDGIRSHAGTLCFVRGVRVIKHRTRASAFLCIALAVSASASARSILGAGRESVVLRWTPASGPVVFYEVTCAVAGRREVLVGSPAEVELEIARDAASWGERLEHCVVQAFDAAGTPGPPSEPSADSFEFLPDADLDGDSFVGNLDLALFWRRVHRGGVLDLESWATIGRTLGCGVDPGARVYVDCPARETDSGG